MNKGKIVARGSPNSLIANLGRGTMIVLAGAGPVGLRALGARDIPALLEGDDVIIHVAGIQEVRATLLKLATIDFPLDEMYTRRDTLEDVFLRVVGARMREGVLAE